MPISVVVGGQFGSEGKGKAALQIARASQAAAVVRVGGTNSGHTGVDENGRTWALRQLPASILAQNTIAILPAGAIIDPEILLSEVKALGLGPNRVIINPQATVITQADKDGERSAGLIERLGSTGSGSGAALMRRMARQDNLPILAAEHGALTPYLGDTSWVLRGMLDKGARVVIEGSQGYGLSLLHGLYPKTTSRDTTAGTFVGEAGLSPRDVDDITLVIRTFPIRVAGDSGLLPRETTWESVARRAGLAPEFHELTTATKKVRRVGEFDAEIVRRAIEVNQPNRIVLNHFDYIDPKVREGIYSPEAMRFLNEVVETPLGRKVDWLGLGPDKFIERSMIESIYQH